MSWTGLLTREIEHTYKAAEGLLDLVDEDKLDWKPATGTNWLTMGQLVKHVATACGGGFHGFVTGDWQMPDGVDLSDLSPEDMLPPAEKFPTVESVAEAKRLLADDKKMAVDALAGASEEDLTNKNAPAPWDPTEMTLGHRLLETVDHLKSHKSQLFYYLKLQGKPVTTHQLWGM